MQVNFYTFSKKENSTYRPSGSGTSFGCILKSTSSIASPIIELDIGTSTNPAGYNYCYIPDFDRYYYIAEWTWIENRLWEASLITDVLATFRDEIGASTLYVLRSSAAYDGNIPDNYYPVKAEAIRDYKYAAYQWPLTVAGGTIVCGIVSKEATIGSICYYALTLGQFSTLITALLDDTILTDFDAADASIALQKALVDPVQYIRSAVYIPLDISEFSGTSNANIKVWDWDPAATGKKLDMSVPWTEKSFSLTLSQHPLAATRGNYLNASPYTRATFEFIPFGTFDIDTTLTAGYSTIDFTYLIDWVNGTGTLQAVCGNNMIGTLSAQIGVPVQISQVSKDYLEAAVNAGNTVGNIVSNVMSGNWGGLISGVSSGIGNGVQAMIPRSANIGSNGSYSHLHFYPSLYQEFYTPVDEDLNHAGRPLCALRTISSIPGYILVKDGDVDMNGFEGEAEAVRQYLESGFYYG